MLRFATTLILLLAVTTAFAGDGNYANPWQPGDLMVNLSGNDVMAARSDASGFDPANPSAGVTIFTKTSFRPGHIAQLDPANPTSDLFVVAGGDGVDDQAVLYRGDRATGVFTAVNSALEDDPAFYTQGGIASDGSYLYIYDGSNSVDRYGFDGTLVTDDYITGVNSGGYGGTNQLSCQDGYLYVATGGNEIQWADVGGGGGGGGGAAAQLILGDGNAEFVGVYAAGDKLFTANSDSDGGNTGTIVSYDLTLAGTPGVSNPVIEGAEDSGAYLSSVVVDRDPSSPNYNQIYAGLTGSFGSAIAGKVIEFDFDGDLETIGDDTVFTGLPNGGNTNVFLFTPEPTSLLLLAFGATVVIRRRR